MSYKIELDHIGIATPSLDGARFFEVLGLENGGRETVDTEGVKVEFWGLANEVNVELLEATKEEGPIAKFLDKRGPGVHHICFRVQGIEELVKHLKSQGVQMINETPKVGAHNCRVVFIHPKSTGGVLVELSERSGE